ncbi:17378_t:CDS:1, partial [Dentiscutata heterogama]
TLFLTSTYPFAPASTDTIARWIKNILTVADPDTKAKDIRAILAFLA